MKKSLIFLLVIPVAFILSSCSLYSGEPFEVKESPLYEYFPMPGETTYTYRVIMDEKPIERELKWEGTDEPGGQTVHFFTDGKNFTKAYELTEDAVLLRGISLLNQGKVTYYKGDNPCLKLPLEPGAAWSVNAALETETTLIRQTGTAEIVKMGKHEVGAGTFDSIKVFFNVSSEYQVLRTGEKSVVTAQFFVWYGKGVGLIRQLGTALVEKENRVIQLKQELVQIDPEEGE